MAEALTLKPCPFCGKRPAFDHTRAEGVRFSCFDCEEAAFDDFEQAAEFWNRRSEPEALRLLGEVEKALESIARNTCCDTCQEAALVAKAALDKIRKGMG